jgi:glucose-6-phosphate 1-dehydrogenase
VAAVLEQQPVTENSLVEGLERNLAHEGALPERFELIGVARSEQRRQEFRYETSFVSQSPEAYERLVRDAMRGDATLFTRNDEVEAQWGIVDPILRAWAEDTTSPVRQYPAGTAGPSEANALLDDGRRWRRI